MLLQVDGLRKTFGRRAAVDGIGFSLDVGEIVGFLGPNGAGKTTTMRMIAGYLEPDEGVAKIFNIDVAQERRRAQDAGRGFIVAGALGIRGCGRAPRCAAFRARRRRTRSDAGGETSAQSRAAAIRRGR